MSISAGSLGIGAGEYGINIQSGTVAIGNGGIMTLVGMGGGTYSSSGNGNNGVNLDIATFIGGVAGTSSCTMSVTGIGGSGTTGLNNGVSISGSLAVTFNTTGGSNAFTFLNCIGGTVGSSNYGVNLNSATLISGNGGTLQQTINVTGVGGQGNGGSGQGSYSVSGSPPVPSVLIKMSFVGGVEYHLMLLLR